MPSSTLTETSPLLFACPVLFSAGPSITSFSTLEEWTLDERSISRQRVSKFMSLFPGNGAVVGVGNAAGVVGAASGMNATAAAVGTGVVGSAAAAAVALAAPAAPAAPAVAAPAVAPAPAAAAVSSTSTSPQSSTASENKSTPHTSAGSSPPTTTAAEAKAAAERTAKMLAFLERETKAAKAWKRKEPWMQCSMEELKAAINRCGAGEELRTELQGYLEERMYIR